MFHLPKKLLLAILLLLSTVANSALATTAIEFYKADIDHYFMTADSDEATSLDNNKSWNWVRTGKTFDVWLTQASAPSSASPVCRFFGVFANGTVGSHFYTIDQEECAYVKSRIDWGWGYENNAFYAVKPTGGSCPNGASPVYRAFNNGMGGAPNHRYMTSQTDLNTMVSQGWVSEGVAMCSGSSDPINKTNSAKLVGGKWTFYETMGTTIFTDTYTFTSIDSTPDSRGIYFVYGTDKYGDVALGGYSSLLSKWSVISSLSSYYNFFTFTFTDNDHISGCYYFYLKTSTNLGTCYPLSGVRSSSPLGVDDKSSASSFVLLPSTLDPIDEEVKRANAANDTMQRYIEHGVMDSFLLRRKQFQ